MGDIGSKHEVYFLQNGDTIHHNPRKGTFKKVVGEGKNVTKTLLVDKHKLFNAKGQGRKTVVSGVFKEGKLPYGRLWKNGHNWFCGYLNKDLTPKSGTEWYPGTKQIKFKGSYDYHSNQHYGYGKAYDRDGNLIMDGDFHYWRDPTPLNQKWYQEPEFNGWRLYEGQINVDTPEYVCKGRIREGCLSGLYSDKEPQVRLAKGVLEEGRFSWGYLENGTRTETLPDGRQKISKVQRYEVIDYNIVKKKPKQKETKPSAPSVVEIPATGEPDMEIADPVEIEGKVEQKIRDGGDPI